LQPLGLLLVDVTALLCGAATDTQTAQHLHATRQAAVIHANERVTLTWLNTSNQRQHERHGKG